MTLELRRVLCLLAGAVMAACAGDPGEPVDSVAQAATTCGVHAPPADACYQVFCNPDTNAWDETPLPSGAPCSGGTCDGDGNCIVPPPPPPPPPSPTDLQVTARLQTSLSVQFTASPGASAYFVNVNGQDQAVYSTSATFASLTPGTRYCFTVQAWNGGGRSAPSGQVCARTEPAPFDYQMADFGGGAYNPDYQWGNAPFEQQPGTDGTLDSLELPASINDPRLTGFYLYPPSQHAFGSCPSPGSVFIPINGSVSGDALTQVYGTAHPALHDGSFEPYGNLTVSGCAVFGNVRAVGTVMIREHYSTPP